MRRIMLSLNRMDDTLHHGLDAILARSTCWTSPGPQTIPVSASDAGGVIQQTPAYLPPLIQPSSQSVSSASFSSRMVLSGNQQPPRPGPHPSTPAIGAVACASADPQIPPEHQKTVKLGDEYFTFDSRQVPDPPMRHFSQSIPELFVNWESSSILKIGTRGIPLKHWPSIYQKRTGVKLHAWDLIKREWVNWRVRTKAGSMIRV